MADAIEMMIVAAARELVLTRPVLSFWGLRIFTAASAVAFRTAESS